MESQDRRHKKSKKSKKHKKHRRHSSSSEAEEEWVEKPIKEYDRKEISTKLLTDSSETVKRDTWMTDSSLLFPTISRQSKVQDERKTIDEAYNPSKSVRELNPYWKDGGDGLPSLQRKNEFKKPSQVENFEYKTDHSMYKKSSGDWRKKTSVDNKSNIPTEKSIVPTKNEEIINYNLSDKEINELAAKVLKAEILGNTTLCEKLKIQLEKAREYRKTNPPATITKEDSESNVVLTVTDSKGQSCPLQKRATNSSSEQSSHRNKKKKVSTHVGGERVRYFGDDDRYTLKEMFEQEKYRTNNDEDASFMKIASKLRNPNDDLEDIFSEKIQKIDSVEKVDAKNRDNAIRQHTKLSKSLEGCSMCIDSPKFAKDLVIKLGETVCLSLPNYQSMVAGHCLLYPISHVPCATQLDENVWNELQHFRKQISKMFAAQNCKTIFFECAKNLNRYPHMVIECIPIPEEEGSLAPMYFKKAILECEQEWSNNKKLVELKNSNVRRSIPKGLSYFAVEFDTEPGYAHVIEDRRDFPQNFAQEIIGGLLDLDHSVWRKRQQENSTEKQRKVDDFKKMWQKFLMSK